MKAKLTILSTILALSNFISSGAYADPRSEAMAARQQYLDRKQSYQNNLEDSCERNGGCFRMDYNGAQIPNKIGR